MRLSAIKLAGFKSFIDPTTLRVPGKLTGVVGPNGCGKSNVIDAVRWVLGEMSVKQLRGEASQDVIFNGSRTRKPVGRCSAELIFDNSEGKLGGQYAAFGEISVKRELSRDGESHYYINSARCRRRDVVDLFLGTGLGGRSNYAIIEQGMMAQLIEAKPEEVRMLLEEAAGISKYKERRRETESRMKETRENLARLNDLLTELRQRLEQLKRQAENAGKFTRFKDQERRFKAELIVLREQALQAEAADKSRSMGEARQALQAQQEALRALEMEREQLRLKHNEATHVCQTLQGEFYGAEAALARLEQSLAHTRELQEVKQQELHSLTQQLVELGARVREESQRQAQAHEHIRRLEGVIGSADATEAEVREQVAAADAAAQDALERWERFNHEAQAPQAQEAAERTRVEQLERQAAALAETIHKLEDEHNSLALGPLEAQFAEATQNLGRHTRELETAQTQAVEQERQLAVLRERRSELEGKLHEVRQALQDARGRLASFEALQQAALREDDPRLQQWLAAQGWPPLKRLAQCIEVEPGWERAVEAVLGDFLQALCVEGLEGRLPAAAAWPAVPLALLEAAEVTPPTGGLSVAHSLADKLRGPAAVRALLSTVYALESEGEAAQLRPRLQAGQMLVTRAGQCHGPHWVRHAGSGGDEMHGAGVLAREQAIKGLRGQVRQLDVRAAEFEHSLSTVRDQQAAGEQQRQSAQQALDRLRQQHGEQFAAQQAHSIRLEQARLRIAAVQGELEQQRTQAAALQQEAAAARTRQAELAAQTSRLGEQRQRLQEELKSLREQLTGVRQTREASAAEIQRLRVELAGQQSTDEALARTLAELVQRQTAAETRRVALERELQAASQVAAAPQDAQTQARAKRDALQSQLEAARRQQDAIEEAGAQLVQRVHAAEQTLEQMREALQQIQLAEQALEVRRQGLLDQLPETGFTPEALRAGLPADAGVAAWEEQLAATERRIQRLGPINLAAISEFEEQNAREQQLAAHYNDLTAALATLEEAIRKIDRETRALFQTTFDEVNRTFQAIFPKLFGGGESVLELTGDDLLETGVRVMARPPGKRNSTIHQLSGGEKALTAVALLFALFELNPAPFCMLDEVDAPLDDANIARFCELVREMSSRVQFVVITHNKLTMELMDQLNGVTMQEPGVSRLVSVDVEQALALAG